MGAQRKVVRKVATGARVAGKNSVKHATKISGVKKVPRPHVAAVKRTAYGVMGRHHGKIMGVADPQGITRTLGNTLSKPAKRGAASYAHMKGWA